MLELAFLRIIVVNLVEQVLVEVCPFLEGVLLAEHTRGHVAGYEGSLDEQCARAAHGVDEVGLAVPAGHENHSGRQHLVERGLNVLLPVAAAVQALAAGVEREGAPVFGNVHV